MNPFDMNVLANDLRMYLGGCPVPTIRAKLNEATRDFCRRSLVWVEKLTPIAPVEDQAIYTIAPPVGVEVIDLDGVAQFNGSTTDDLEPYPENRTIATEITGSLASFYYRESQLEFGIWPKPAHVNTAHVLTPRVAVMPELAGSSVDADFYTRWKHGLMAGTLSLCYQIPQKEWTDLQQASIQEARFSSIIADAIGNRLSNNNRRPLVATWPSL